jgi:hypothetical protein
MIPRTLVPVDARLPADAGVTTRRRPTNLDERTLVPAMLQVVPLDGHSNIPSNLPLESIAARVVVPRDINRVAYRVVENHSTPAQPSEMDSRIAVPVGAAPPIIIEPAVGPTPDIVNPDVFLTGDVHFVAEPAKGRSVKWDAIVRVSSVAFHFLLLAAILLLPKLFPPHEPTPEEVDIARKQLTLLLPPGSFDSKPEIRPAPQPRVKVDPRVLKKVAPEPPPPTPAPVIPERPKESLPSAPVAKNSAAPPTSNPDPKPDAPKAPLKLDLPDTPPTQHGIVLPKSSSPGQSIQESLHPSNRPSGPRPILSGGAISGRSQGGGGPSAYGGLEMLTPDQGVDFSGYLMRVYLAVKRNWFAVMPESAQLGERGIVSLTFRIMRDGSVPGGEPIIHRNSGKEPLDRAAYSSVRASNPFEPLPPQFSGPYIELRYTYFYNISPDSLNQ